MNAKAKPDHSKGGTFLYDKDGNFVEHIPPTKPRSESATKAEAGAQAQADKATAKKGQE